MADRSSLRHKHGSVKKQVFKQAVVVPVLATVHTISQGIHGLAHATTPSMGSRSIDNPPDASVSEAGCCRYEPPSPVGSSNNHLSLEENLLSAPPLAINPRFIAALPEELLPEKLEDKDLQNAVVYQNSKLFEKPVGGGQWVVELIS